jgi:hypothetical protein
MRKTKVGQYLKPLAEEPVQAYLGKGLHLLGLLQWIIQQVGVIEWLGVSTYSTSDEFLSGIINLKRERLLRTSVLIADVKAAKKTVILEDIMKQCFDEVILAENHSKVMLIMAYGVKISVISSQNQTYGGRSESTMITTLPDVFESLNHGFMNIVSEGVSIYGLHTETTGTDTSVCGKIDSTFRDFRPFGAQE